MFRISSVHLHGDSCVCTMASLTCISVSMQNIPYCIHNCLPEDEPTRFETFRRQHKLNIKIENCAFSRFVMLYLLQHLSCAWHYILSLYSVQQYAFNPHSWTQRVLFLVSRLDPFADLTATSKCHEYFESRSSSEISPEVTPEWKKN